MPATATGRGAQVVIDPSSNTAKAIRGSYAASLEANLAKVAADIAGGVVSDGNRPDGTTTTAAATDLAVVGQAGTGIQYSVASPNNHSMAFGWNGSWTLLYVDGTFTGYVPFSTPTGAVPFFSLTNAANDAAAASAGVPVSGLYRNGSVVMQRIT